ncbi:class III lanthipeptide [Amycolatopsis jiangsuensis]|uniref:SapB/AmfS family lantipeptide n=1 Tax=Amycolatopsis jiangsuensis TaxID=1181879 RepID=A0A840IZA9_9PSEU|nr:class III lanthipeptide [Amycolatopsis jiangsuensis]MBB4686849.1 hypothetical protein [Amycolatopsis jiangsuensis]
MEHVLELQALETPEALEGHDGLDHHGHDHSHLSLHCGYSGLSLLLCD